MDNILSKTLSFGGFKEKRLDHATLWGAVAAFGLVFFAIYLGGGLRSFFNLQGLLIVIGGTLGATLVNYPLDDFLKTFVVLKTAFFSDGSSTSQRIRKLLTMSRRMRADGPLALQNDMFREPDAFLRKATALVVDGIDPKEIRRILEIELTFLEDRHRHGAQLFQTMGTISPAMGLIGTLIGLVQMLSNLDDPSQIGPAMALALLTTFYGALFANIVFLPLAGKLRTRSKEERLIKELSIEGVIGVAEGTNPRLIEQRLLSFLPPEKRESEYE